MKEGNFNMIKTEKNQKPSNVLEALRLMSESVSDWGWTPPTAQ